MSVPKGTDLLLHIRLHFNLSIFYWTMKTHSKKPSKINNLYNEVRLMKFFMKHFNQWQG